MAHQAHNIPWGLLASNLEWKTPTPWENFATNLYPRMKPNQAKDLTHFVDAFVKNLDEHSRCERKKYPKYDSPDPNDVILDDDVVRKISPTVRRWRDDWPSTSLCPSGKCKRYEIFEDNGRFPGYLRVIDDCKCEPLPQKERIMSAFLRDPHVQIDWGLGSDDSNDEAIFNIQVLYTLLLYGEMDPILRVCAHPSNHLKFWLDAEYFFIGPVFGWKRLCRYMLSVYICLNIAYCFPETWDFESGRSAEKDYRNAKFYQKTLVETCTSFGSDWDLRKYPHSQFFGMESCESLKRNTGKSEHWLLDEDISKAQRMGEGSHYRVSGYSERYDRLGPYGRVPIRDFLSLCSLGGCSYLPSSFEVDEVIEILCSKGLPVELALEIVKFANYKPPTSKLDPPHDPLHPLNRKALGEYLKYCWKTLVLCYTMGSEIGLDPLDRLNTENPTINWKNLIADTIIDLFGHHKDRRGNEYGWGDWEVDMEKLPRLWYKKERVSDDDAPMGWRGPFTIFV